MRNPRFKSSFCPVSVRPLLSLGGWFLLNLWWLAAVLRRRRFFPVGPRPVGPRRALRFYRLPLEAFGTPARNPDSCRNSDDRHVIGHVGEHQAVGRNHDVTSNLGPAHHFRPRAEIHVVADAA